MTNLRFGIRDVLWAIVVIGLAIGWRLDHRNQVANFWELRGAISNAQFRTSMDNGKYYIEPMNQYQLELHRRKKGK